MSSNTPDASLDLSPLGKVVNYPSEYDSKLLFAIPRAPKRIELGLVDSLLPFYGYDLWNAYEVSWLNKKGKPEVRIAEIIYSANSPYIIESKSLKLYLNSINNSTLIDDKEVESLISRDLSITLNTSVKVTLLPLNCSIRYGTMQGICLDELDIYCTPSKDIRPEWLASTDSKTIVSEVVHSNLLKSNCPITGQPDWAGIEVVYSGPQINHENLLQYLVSFRNHNEYHEQCIERIFIDITRYCKPNKLSVYGRYTRRGGIDINPFRSTEDNLLPNNVRNVRQ